MSDSLNIQIMTQLNVFCLQGPIMRELYKKNPLMLKTNAFSRPALKYQSISIVDNVLFEMDILSLNTAFNFLLICKHLQCTKQKSLCWPSEICPGQKPIGDVTTQAFSIHCR